jgi:hypothetical protein
MMAPVDVATNEKATMSELRFLKTLVAIINADGNKGPDTKPTNDISIKIGNFVVLKYGNVNKNKLIIVEVKSKA